MRRGTTPTITVEIDADLSDLSINLAFDAGALVVKGDEDLQVSVDEGVTTISTTLTQEDTLAMTAGKDCQIQVRAYRQDGTMAMATSIGRVPVERILEDGVLPHDEEPVTPDEPDDQQQPIDIIQ